MQIYQYQLCKTHLSQALYSELSRGRLCKHLTPEVLSDAQGQAVLGPLNNARVVEDNTGQDHPLAPHHRLVCRLLREPRRPHWRLEAKQREWERENRDWEN